MIGYLLNSWSARKYYHDATDLGLATKVYAHFVLASLICSGGVRIVASNMACSPSSGHYRRWCCWYWTLLWNAVCLTWLLPISSQLVRVITRNTMASMCSWSTVKTNFCQNWEAGWTTTWRLCWRRSQLNICPIENANKCVLSRFARLAHVKVMQNKLILDNKDVVEFDLCLWCTGPEAHHEIHHNMGLELGTPALIASLFIR